jgi:2-dehydropantoate 2-reductase
MRILLLGAGAVGLTVAAKLSTYADVFAVCRKQYADAVGKDGLVISGLWGNDTIPLDCGETVPEGEWDYILITAKSPATKQICEEYRHLFKNAEIVSLQNGIGNEEIIAAYTGHIIGAMIITGFEWRGSNAVHVSVDGGDTVFGRFPQGTDDAVRELAGLFSRAGMRASVSDTIRDVIWSKALYSCSLNPLGAVMECPYGELLRTPAWNIITGIVREAFSVAEAEGISLPGGTPDGYLAYLRNDKIPPTAQHYSSMYQDIRAGKRTEVDYINGAVISLGEKHRIATPVNSAIVNLVHFKEELS